MNRLGDCKMQDQNFAEKKKREQKAARYLKKGNFYSTKRLIEKISLKKYRFQDLTGGFDKSSYTFIKFGLAQRFCKNNTDKLSAACEEQIRFDG